jgi:hypothetical protein
LEGASASSARKIEDQMGRARDLGE